MRVLYLTHRLPYAPNRGDRVRAFHTLRLLAQRAEVHVVSLVHDREEASHVDLVRTVAASVRTVLIPRLRNLSRAACALPTDRPLTHVLLDAPALDETLRDVYRRHSPDVVLAYCSGMARLALQAPLADTPFVLDLVDVDSQKWTDLAERSTGLLRWVYRREARLLGAFEALAATRAATTILVNQREADVARRLAPRANVQVVGNGVDLESLRPRSDAPRAARVVFCGVMNYRPNEEGAVWLVRHVWPIVHRRRPHATLALVGSHPTRRLRAACDPDLSIDLVGGVPDVRPFLWQAAVTVAPLQIARGLQNKVLEALAAGLPPVVTPAVAAGLPATARLACSVAQTPEHFAAAIVKLLDSTEYDRSALVGRACLEQLDWPRTLAPLWPLLEAAAQRRGSPGGLHGLERTA